MLSKFKRNKHQQHLAQLPKISQSVDDVDFFYAPADFRETLLEKIASAKQRICIVALYLEQDDGGKGILNALYEAKRQRPELDVRVLVDWHRAQRGRIGAAASNTNADWYCRMAQENPGVDVPVYGVPINTREALGVLHFKGFIIDDSVLYSGASLNDAVGDDRRARVRERHSGQNDALGNHAAHSGPDAGIERNRGHA